MSILAKIFIVLNLLIAMAFTVATLTLYAKRLHWVEYAAEGVKENNTLYQENVNLTKELGETKASLEKVKIEKEDQKVALESVIAEKQSKVTSLLEITDGQRSELVNINAQIVNLQAEVKRKEARNAKLQQMVDALVLERNDYRRRMEFAEQRVIEALADLKQSETELMNIAKQNAELVRRVAMTATRLDAYVKRYGPLQGEPIGPEIRGRVLRTEPEIQLVILDVGKKDDVRKGMEFLISRGDKLVGKVRVQNVLEDMSSARVLTPYNADDTEIQVADVARTPNM